MPSIKSGVFPAVLAPAMVILGSVCANKYATFHATDAPLASSHNAQWWLIDELPSGPDDRVVGITRLLNLLDL